LARTLNVRVDSQKEQVMARVALVTGGTRGIGAAISKALQAAGYKVAGNDAAAQKFKAETGIAGAAQSIVNRGVR
jgi:NAD(P)-dependent dehydrogenase (short-subunit alcohol dehydrogenase family)